MRQLRGSVHPTKHAFPACKSLFGRIPSRMAVPLKDIVDQNTLVEDGHVFMGFSKDGEFVISYTLLLDFGEDSAMPYYSYKLHWWKFRDRQPMVKVSEVVLFAEEKINKALHLAVCSWPTDNTKILVYGCASSKPCPDEKLACYVTITAVPQYSPCPSCTHIKNSGDYTRTDRDGEIPFGDIPPELADEFGPDAFIDPTPPCCLRHSYAVHTRFEMSPPFPGFSPIHSMRKDGVVVLNSGDTLIALSVHLCQVSDAVFSPSAGKLSFKDTPQKDLPHTDPQETSWNPLGNGLSQKQNFESSGATVDGRLCKHLASPKTEEGRKKSEVIEGSVTTSWQCHHALGKERKISSQPRDLIDILDCEAEPHGESNPESCSIQRVFEACCQTCRLCQEISQGPPMTTETLCRKSQEITDSLVDPDCANRLEQCLFHSASDSSSRESRLDELSRPRHVEDMLPPRSKDECPQIHGKASPKSLDYERWSNSRETTLADILNRPDFERKSSSKSKSKCTNSERQLPDAHSNLCNVSDGAGTPIASGILQNLRHTHRLGSSSFPFEVSSQVSDSKSSIGSELEGSCPYHCPDFDDTQDSTATIKDCTCNMQRIFYALRRFVERSSIEDGDNGDQDGFGPDYHNMVPIHVTGPYDMAPLRKTSIVSPEVPCIEVRQITLDAEHYICDAICKRASWGKRYISFTDYDMNILDVCPESSIVYVLLKALVRAWPESKSSADIFEFDDNPTSDTPQVYETGFSFAWNLKTGTYDTLHIEDLSPFDQSQLSKMWNPGFLLTLQLQRKSALPQNHSNSVHILTNEAVFRNKSLTRLLDPVHYVAIILT